MTLSGPTPGQLDVILAAVVLEAIVLGTVLAGSGRGRYRRLLWTCLASGAFLLVALRLALAGHDSSQVAAALLAAGVAHVAMLREAWRQLADTARAAPRRSQPGIAPAEPT